jgi:hypothetical protein
MVMIQAEGLSKVFRVSEKQPGLGGDTAMLQRLTR